MKVTESKEGDKPFLVKGFCHELVGVDGQLPAGLRPFPGFRQVHEFKDVYSVAPHNGSPRKSLITDVYSFNCLVDDDYYAYGVVYRIREPTHEDWGDLFMDFWCSKDKVWHNANTLYISDSLTDGDGDGVPDYITLPPHWQATLDAGTYPYTAGAQNGMAMAVKSTGRLVYVFVQDRPPILFYITATSTPTMTLVTSTGPNERPTLRDPYDALDMGALRVTESTSRDGAGQVLLLEFYPSEVGLGLTQADEDVGSLLAGNYSFAFRLRDSVTGRLTGLSEIAQSRWSDFDPLAYSGSASGGGSGFTSGSGFATGSAVQALFAAIEIVYDPDKYDQAYIYRSARVEGAGGTFTSKILFLERIITLADYHTVNSPLADEGGRSRAQSVYYYELEDKALVQKPTYADQEIFDEKMPRAGAAEWYETTMLASNLRTAAVPSSTENTLVDPNLGVGEIRWSSLWEFSPELFPVYNRYVPSIPSDDVILFRPAGPHIIGLSRNKQYVIRKETGDIRVEPIHDGYGVVNQWAADTVGSLVYLVTPGKGMKTVDSVGQLDDVRFLNKLLVDDWASTIESISVAYDPTAGCLYVLNPETEEAAILWFNTAQITELSDMTFDYVTRGVWPTNFTWDRSDFQSADGANNITYGNPLREQAMFLLNYVFDGGVTATNEYPGLYVPDYLRERTQSVGSFGATYTDSTFIEASGDAVHTVSTYTQGLGILVMTLGGKVLPDQVSNRYLYVLKSDTVTVGTKALIHRKQSSTSIVIESGDRANLAGLAAGDIVGFSPCFFEVSAWPLAVQDETGQTFGSFEDFFYMRQANSLGAYYTDVTGSSLEEASTVARYQALLYKGASDTAAQVVDIVDPGGTSVISIKEDEATNYAGFGRATDGVSESSYGYKGNCLTPGVRVFCPNVDFRLLGFVVNGRVLPTSRGTLPTI